MVRAVFPRRALPPRARAWSSAPPAWGYAVRSCV